LGLLRRPDSRFPSRAEDAILSFWRHNCGWNCGSPWRRARHLRRNRRVCCVRCFSRNFIVTGSRFSAEILTFERAETGKNSGAIAVFPAVICCSVGSELSALRPHPSSVTPAQEGIQSSPGMNGGSPHPLGACSHHCTSGEPAWTGTGLFAPRACPMALEGDARDRWGDEKETTGVINSVSTSPIMGRNNSDIR
jgi:hypothetical protein